MRVDSGSPPVGSYVSESFVLVARQSVWTECLRLWSESHLSRFRKALRLQAERPLFRALFGIGLGTSRAWVGCLVGEISHFCFSHF